MEEEKVNKQQGLLCLEYDRRKDSVAMPNCRTKKIENVSVISQPGHEFVDFFQPHPGTGLAHANELHKIVVETKSEHTFRIIKSDGCK